MQKNVENICAVKNMLFRAHENICSAKKENVSLYRMMATIAKGLKFIFMIPP